MKLGGNAHRAELVVGAHASHGGPAVAVAVEQAHRRRGGVEGQLGGESVGKVIAALRVVMVQPIRHHIGGIDGHGEVDVARKGVDLVDRRVGGRQGRDGRHQRKMSAGAAAGEADLLRVESAGLGLAAHDADGALRVLPGGDVLREALRARRAVLHRHHGHALGEEEVADGRDLEPLDAVAHVAAAGHGDHHGVARLLFRHVPDEVGLLGLVLLGGGHLPLWPQRHLRPGGPKKGAA